MSGRTGIEWADATWNPISGCTKISPGCANCYAEKMAKRLKAMGVSGYENGFAVTLQKDRLSEPLHWRKPRRVFVGSMGDLFHEDVPFMYIERIWNRFYDCSFAPEPGGMKFPACHQFLILTKRPERMAEFYRWMDSERARNANYPNIWLGATVENQGQAETRLDCLLNIPAAVRFVSVEPMLGPVDLTPWLTGWSGKNTALPLRLTSELQSLPDLSALSWVICGGETGPNARPMNPDWVRSLRDQCVSAGVPFFFKSWGEWVPFKPECGGPGCYSTYKLNLSGYPEEDKREIMAKRWADGRPASIYDTFRVGKKKAGRVLDGRTWDEFPEVKR